MYSYIAGVHHCWEYGFRVADIIACVVPLLEENVCF
jgi:hypothetical protein